MIPQARTVGAVLVKRSIHRTTTGLNIYKNGKAIILTLNRPKALNSLDTAMCADLKSLLLQWRDEDEGRRPLLFVVKGAGDRSFCAGGDVKAVWQELQEMRTRSQSVGTGARGSLHVDFFRTEYEMNYLLGTTTIPQVSLWNGIVMGGGVGISVLGKYRVATEKTIFAMPETAIGLFPDVGSSYWLPKLKPAGFGLYMGLSGARLEASDLIQTEIATHFVLSSHLENLESDLSKIDDSRQVDQILATFHLKSLPFLKTSNAVLPLSAVKITDVFASHDDEPDVRLEKILEKLSARARTCSWSKDTLERISNMSRTSLLLTQLQLKRGATMTLKECLEMEFRLMMRCIAAPDFTEGIRAVLIDKDHSPRWVSTPNSQGLRDYFSNLEKAENELAL